eukprot:jgi/Botrbrau1/18459/Bobra.0072s0042.1
MEALAKVVPVRCLTELVPSCLGLVPNLQAGRSLSGSSRICHISSDPKDSSRRAPKQGRSSAQPHFSTGSQNLPASNPQVLAPPGASEGIPPTHSSQAGSVSQAAVTASASQLFPVSPERVWSSSVPRTGTATSPSAPLPSLLSPSSEPACLSDHSLLCFDPSMLALGSLPPSVGASSTCSLSTTASSTCSLTMSYPASSGQAAPALQRIPSAESLTSTFASTAASSISDSSGPLTGFSGVPTGPILGSSNVLQWSKTVHPECLALRGTHCIGQKPPPPSACSPAFLPPAPTPVPTRSDPPLRTSPPRPQLPVSPEGPQFPSPPPPSNGQDEDELFLSDQSSCVTSTMPALGLQPSLPSSSEGGPPAAHTPASLASLPVPLPQAFADPAKRMLKYVCTECKTVNSVSITPEHLGMKAVELPDAKGEVLEVLAQMCHKQGMLPPWEEKRSAAVGAPSQIQPSPTKCSSASSTIESFNAGERFSYGSDGIMQASGERTPLADTLFGVADLSAWNCIASFASGKFKGDLSSRTSVSLEDVPPDAHMPANLVPTRPERAMLMEQHTPASSEDGSATSWPYVFPNFGQENAFCAYFNKSLWCTDTAQFLWTVVSFSALLLNTRSPQLNHYVFVKPFIGVIISFLPLLLGFFFEESRYREAAVAALRLYSVGCTPFQLTKKDALAGDLTMSLTPYLRSLLDLGGLFLMLLFNQVVRVVRAKYSIFLLSLEISGVVSQIWQNDLLLANLMSEGRFKGTLTLAVAAGLVVLLQWGMWRKERTRRVAWFLCLSNKKSQNLRKSMYVKDGDSAKELDCCSKSSFSSKTSFSAGPVGISTQLSKASWPSCSPPDSPRLDSVTTPLHSPVHSQKCLEMPSHEDDSDFECDLEEDPTQSLPGHQAQALEQHASSAGTEALGILGNRPVKGLAPAPSDPWQSQSVQSGWCDAEASGDLCASLPAEAGPGLVRAPDLQRLASSAAKSDPCGGRSKVEEEDEAEDWTFCNRTSLQTVPPHGLEEVEQTASHRKAAAPAPAWEVRRNIDHTAPDPPWEARNPMDNTAPDPPWNAKKRKTMDLTAPDPPWEARNPMDLTAPDPAWEARKSVDHPAPNFAWEAQKKTHDAASDSAWEARMNIGHKDGFEDQYAVRPLSELPSTVPIDIRFKLLRPWEGANCIQSVASQALPRAAKTAVVAGHLLPHTAEAAGVAGQALRHAAVGVAGQALPHTAEAAVVAGQALPHAAKAAVVAGHLLPYTAEAAVAAGQALPHAATAAGAVGHTLPHTAAEAAVVAGQALPHAAQAAGVAGQALLKAARAAGVAGQALPSTAEATVVAGQMLHHAAKAAVVMSVAVECQPLPLSTKAESLPDPKALQSIKRSGDLSPLNLDSVSAADLAAICCSGSLKGSRRVGGGSMPGGQLESDFAAANFLRGPGKVLAADVVSEPPLTRKYDGPGPSKSSIVAGDVTQAVEQPVGVACSISAGEVCHVSPANGDSISASPDGNPRPSVHQAPVTGCDTSPLVEADLDGASQAQRRKLMLANLAAKRALDRAYRVAKGREFNSNEPWGRLASLGGHEEVQTAIDHALKKASWDVEGPPAPSAPLGPAQAESR